MRTLIVLLCVAFGALIGFVARPVVLPESSPADPPARQPASISPRTAEREHEETDAPAADPAPERDPPASNGEARAPADPSTLQGLVRALRDPATDEEAIERMAKVLVSRAGPGGVDPAITLDLMRRSEGLSAKRTIEGWSDADLILGLSSALPDDSEADVFRDLAPWIVFHLYLRRGVEIPESLVRALMEHEDDLLRRVGGTACLCPASPRPELLLEFFRTETDPDVLAHTVACLDELVSEHALPPEKAAPLIFAAARLPSREVQKAAVEAFRALGSVAADEALALLSDRTFRESAQEDSLHPLLTVLVRAGRLEAVPTEAWDRSLAEQVTDALLDGLEDHPDGYAPATRVFPRILPHLDSRDEYASCLFDVAMTHGDTGFVESSARDRSLPWRVRAQALNYLWGGGRSNEALASTALTLSYRIIRDRGEDAPLRIHLIRQIEPLYDVEDVKTWIELLRPIAKSDPNEWVRIAATEEVREYE